MGHDCKPWSEVQDAGQALAITFGPMPSQVVPLQFELNYERPRSRYTLFQGRIQAGKPLGVSWSLALAWPRGASWAPLLVSPDACWPHVVGPPALHQCLQQGVALAWVDRTQWCSDDANAFHLGPIHSRWKGHRWSAMAVWAWGLGLTCLALRRFMGQQISVLSAVGHSRGGKAALLAAAWTAAIDAVVANNSGTAGAASLRRTCPGSETLQQLVQAFPHWLAPQVARTRVQQALIDADAPFLWLRSIAPRGLCILQAADDTWANPEGTRYMVDRLAPFWRDCPGRLHWCERSGGHPMTAADWFEAAAFTWRLHQARQAHAHPTGRPEAQAKVGKRS